MTRRHGGVARTLLAILPILAVALAPRVFAGALVLGKPTIQDGQYTFPVSLNGADNQVSSMDFRVQFDPSVFQPVSAAAGNSALAANKMVTANYANPGEYVVVMMGLNQSVVPGGPVASVVLQRVGDTTASGNSQVAITDPTLAAPDGSELQASGSAYSVDMGGGKDTPETETPAPSTAENGKGDPASSPATPQASNGGAPQAAAGKGLATRPQAGIDLGAGAAMPAGQPASPAATLPAAAVSGAVPPTAENPGLGPVASSAATSQDALASPSSNGEKKFSTNDPERVHNTALGRSERSDVAPSTNLASATIESSRTVDSLVTPAAQRAETGTATPQGEGALKYGVIGGVLIAAVVFGAILLRRSIVR